MKKVIYMLAAAAVMASCAKTEMNVPATAAEGAAIQARSKHNGVTASLTRAPFEGAIGGSNTLEAQVLTYRADKTLWADGNMIFTDDNTTEVGYEAGATATKFGADKAEEYTMYGFYPAASPAWALSDADDDSDDATMTITLDGKTDVMIAPAVTTTSTAQQAGTFPLLTFGHQLTKLIVQINAEDAEAGAEWGLLKDIKVKKLANDADNLTPTLTCALVDGAVTFGGTPLSSFGFYSYDGTDYLNTDYDGLTDIAFDTDNTTFATVAYTMVPPFDVIEGNDIELEVTAETTNGDRVIAVPVKVTTPTSGNSTQGYAYTIKLTFDMNIIKAKATVTDWEPGVVEDNVVV